MNNSELDGFRKTLKTRQAELTDGRRHREALTIETSADEFDRIQYAQERERGQYVRRDGRSQHRSQQQLPECVVDGLEDSDIAGQQVTLGAPDELGETVISTFDVEVRP